MNYIAIIGVFQALIALGLAFFFSRKGTDDRDGVLSLLLISISLHLGNSFILNVFLPNAEIHRQFNTFIALFYPVLLWSYTRRIAGTRSKWERLDLIHLIPGGIAAICYFAIVTDIIMHGGKTPAVIHTYNKVSGYAFILVCAIYPILCFRLIHRIRPFWIIEKRFVLFGAILFSIIALYMTALTVAVRLSPSVWTEFNLHLWSRIILYSFLSMICAYAGFIKLQALYVLQAESSQKPMGWKQPVILVPDPKKHTAESPVSNIIISPIDLRPEFPSDGIQDLTFQRRHAVSGVDYRSIAAKADQLMKEEQVYTDPELTLDSLAGMIGVSRHHLSETINQHLGKSFYQYVNEFRIRQVVIFMDQCRDQGSAPNILSLAFEAGFHSKSSFNQYFKKMMGCTPSAYMRPIPPDDLQSVGYYVANT